MPEYSKLASSELEPIGIPYSLSCKFIFILNRFFRALAVNQPFLFAIPTKSDPLEFELKPGESIFILGSNGSGKSSLMQRLYAPNRERAVRISAQRQNWFTSDSIDMTPTTKRQVEQNIRSYDSSVQSRWRDNDPGSRANLAIYELIDAQNIRARAIAEKVDTEKIDEAKMLAAYDAPIKMINELMRLSNLPIEISIQENERVLASKRGSELFSIAELSDGERNVLLTATSVLTAKPGCLILIDEPERHLHRSIISPLLTHLFAKRSDCVFIVSTHEVLLSADHPSSSTLLVRSCEYSGKAPVSWEVDLIPPDAEIDDRTKMDILGSRRKILFVEGVKESLDQPLYSILFPNVSVVSKANCREVEQSVYGISSSEDLHWAEAVGIVDGDGRNPDEIKALAEKNVYALDCYSVESIYYHPEIVKMIAQRVSDVDGSDAEKKSKDAITGALNQLAFHKERLSMKLAEKALRHDYFSKAPNQQTLKTGGSIKVELNVDEAIRKETERFASLLESNDYLGLLVRYPLRETPALDDISRLLGFSSRRKYESAVLKLCSESREGRECALSLLGELRSALETDS